MGVGDGQGSLACCDSWGRRVGHDSATELTEQNRCKIELHSYLNFSVFITNVLGYFPYVSLLGLFSNFG